MNINTSQLLRKFAPIALGVLAGALVGVLLGLIAGETPWAMADILRRSWFGSRFDLGMTLYYLGPLLLTGLAVALPFKVRLFNIGAEGQLAMGAMAAAIVGILWPNLPPVLAIPLGVTAAFLGGALWGFIPGWLLVKRGSHEVITTIMLNFVAASIVSLLTMNFFKNPLSQSPESAIIGPGFRLPFFAYFDEAPLGPSILLALLVVVVVYVFLQKSVFGYRMRIVGANEDAALAAGIPSGRIKIITFAMAGGMAGLVGVTEVMGTSHHFRIGFSPGYGFLGIAVALLARGRILGLIPAALLFAMLFKGAGDLEFETEAVTKEFALIIQGVMILLISSEGLWRRWFVKSEESSRG